MTRKMFDESSSPIRAKDGREMHPRSLANLKSWQPGETGNPATNLNKKRGASVKQWMTIFIESEKYTLKDMREILSSPEDDASVPMNKRIAAQRTIECCEAGREGREATNLLLDRVDGRPAQSITVQASGPDRSDQLTNEALELVQEMNPAALPPSKGTAS